MAQATHRIMEELDDANLVKLSDEHTMKGKIKQRGVKRGQLTKYMRKYNDELPETVVDLNVAIKKVKRMQDSVNILDTEIDSFIVTSDRWSANEYASECEWMEYYQDLSDNLIVRLECKLDELQRPIVAQDAQQNVGGNNVNASNNLHSNRLKLPQMELPTFDGRPEMFEQFIVSFEQSIQRFSLSEYEKFSLLVKQVSGAAKMIIDSVRPDEQTYSVAKDLMTKAFSDKTCQIFSVINRLTSIEFSSIEKSFEWISEARTLAAQVKRLQIDGNCVVQYFLWNSLPEFVKTQFMNVNNVSKPDLDSILDTAFDVFNRLRDTPSTSSKQRTAVALTTNFAKSADNFNNYNSSYAGKSDSCALCEFENISDSGHKILNCPKFSSPDEKLSIINKAGGCVRCGKLNHNVTSCRFRFSGKCKNCGTYHAYFLCSQKVHKNSNVKASGKKYEGKNVPKSTDKNLKPKSVEANIVQYNVMSVTSNENIIPTFTAEVGKFPNVRCMFDPAAQITFASQNLLNKVKYKVIDNNIKVNISGFNISKTTTTKLVELKLKLNNKVSPYNIKAIIVPEIRSKVNTNIDDLVKSFNDADIKLADGYLSSEYESVVDILFGVDNVHMLPVHSCSFGHGDLSAVFYCCQGVMLAGNVDTLRMNVPHLNAVKKFVDDFDSYFR